jgi:hypothetical protein
VVSDNYVKSLACLLAVREEESNGVNGCLGVLFVLRTRVAAGWFGGDLYKNITAKNQFSSMVIKGDNRTVYYADPREPNFQKVLQFVDNVFDGTMKDILTNGAIYYSDLQSAGFQKGGWFDRAIVQRPDLHPRCATIGTTSYFK